MTQNWQDELSNQLCDAFLQLKTREEVYAFLEDVATISEIRALSQRLEVARLLDTGQTYPQIATSTGASTATISRVKKCLDYGPGGYSSILGRLKDRPRSSK
jgi:TrpR-related protein YerC/YecD